MNEKKYGRMEKPEFYCEKFLEHHNSMPKYQPNNCKEQCHKCMDIIIDYHINKGNYKP